MQEKKVFQKNAQAKESAKPKADILPSENRALYSIGWWHNDALVIAASEGDNSKVMEVIECHGANVATAKDESGRTALHEAARWGHVQTCSLLIQECAKAGGDLNGLIGAKNSGSETALHGAVENGHTQIYPMLMEECAKAGGNVKELLAAKDQHGRTVLYYAIRKGDIESCILFIKEYAKADGDVKEFLSTKNDNTTPALYHIVDNRFKTAQFLKSAEWLADVAGNAFMKSFAECLA